MRNIFQGSSLLRPGRGFDPVGPSLRVHLAPLLPDSDKNGEPLLSCKISKIFTALYFAKNMFCSRDGIFRIRRRDETKTGKRKMQPKRSGPIGPARRTRRLVNQMLVCLFVNPRKPVQFGLVSLPATGRPNLGKPRGDPPIDWPATLSTQTTVKTKYTIARRYECEREHIPALYSRKLRILAADKVKL